MLQNTIHDTTRNRTQYNITQHNSIQDNTLHLMKILGHEIDNDPLYVKSYHYHSTVVRDYSYKDIVPSQNRTEHNTTQHYTTQHNTTQHNTTQHNTTQHKTTQHNTTHLLALYL